MWRIGSAQIKGDITVDKCPVCGGFLRMENQVIETARKPGYFSGLGHCFNCGRMRVSGIIEQDIPRILAFTPLCECCLSDLPVVKLNPLDPDDMRWSCLECFTLIEVKRQRLMKLRLTLDRRPALAAV